jgi:type IV pilus assembly protein PilB
LRESRLLKVLKDKKLVPDNKLRQALEYRKKAGPGAKLSDVIVKMGLVNPERMNEIVAESENIQVVDLTGHAVDANAMEKLPREFLEKHGIVPLAFEKGKVMLAMSEPVDFETLEEVQFMTNCLVEPVLAARDQVRKSIEEFYLLPTHERKALV